GAVSPVLVNPQVAYERPAWSPDGASIAYLVRRATSAGEVRHLYLADASGANPRRLTDLEQVTSAAWSPDGSRLVVAAARAPFTSDVLLVSVADGAIQPLTEGQLDQVPTWSPDGRYVALVRGGELVLIRADGTDERVIARLPDAVTSSGLSWKELSAP
ncbi:MAG: PD40 domain-containing protein, partial [Anaerolineae bacterium]|nr:PD40 domain-containing protein [Anaerolineae bacterium]